MDIMIHENDKEDYRFFSVILILTSGRGTTMYVLPTLYVSYETHL